MSAYTPELKLLKKDPVTEGSDTFNIETMLNENWDKIDAAIGGLADEIAAGRVVIHSREREGDKPSYGIGTAANEPIALRLAPLSENAEISAMVNGAEYGVENMSTDEETAAGGTLIIRKLEE